MNKLSIGLLGIALLTIFATTACEKKSKTEQAKEDLNEVVESVNDAFRSEQEELQHDMELGLGKIDKKLAALQEDLTNASEDAKEEINQEIEQWKEKRETLAKDLNRFGEDLEDEWESFKSEVNQSLIDLEKELDSM